MENELSLTLVIAAAVGSALPSLASILYKKLKTFVKKTDTEIDDKILASLEKSIQTAVTKAINKQKETKTK